MQHTQKVQRTVKKEKLNFLNFVVWFLFCSNEILYVMLYNGGAFWSGVGGEGESLFPHSASD